MLIQKIGKNRKTCYNQWLFKNSVNFLWKCGNPQQKFAAPSAPKNSTSILIRKSRSRLGICFEIGIFGRTLAPKIWLWPQNIVPNHDVFMLKSVRSPFNKVIPSLNMLGLPTNTSGSPQICCGHVNTCLEHPRTSWHEPDMQASFQTKNVGILNHHI